MLTGIQAFEEIPKLLRLGRRCALVTIAAAEGSTPRELGARMIVLENGEIIGTIGGGSLEKDAIDVAIEVIKNKTNISKDYNLHENQDPSVNMMCGGKLTLLFEQFEPVEKLIICGGGHIGQALSKIADMLNFEITLIDDRENYATKELFPMAKETIYSGRWEEAFQNVQIDENTYIVILTRQHLGDEACLRQVLGKNAKYIGMIGSKAKVAILKERLMNDGYNKADVESVYSPIGIKIGGPYPEEIAVSIAAELIQIRYQKK